MVLHKLITIVLYLLIVKASYLSLPISKKSYSTEEGIISKQRPHRLIKNRKAVLKRNVSGELETTIRFDQTFVEVHLRIGSNRDPVTLLLDTASSDLVVNSSDNEFCISDGPDPESSFDTSVNSLAFYKREEAVSCPIPNSRTKIRKKSTTTVSENFKYKTESVIGQHLMQHSSNIAVSSAPPYPKIKNYSSTPDPSFIQNHANYLMETTNCPHFGMYDPYNSTSFYNLTTPLNIQYLDGSAYSGFYGTDDVYFADTKISEVQFGLNVETDKEWGTLGIGFGSNENTAQDGLKEYDNFPKKLKREAIIKKQVFSIYAPYNSAPQSLIFGGYDRNGYIQESGLTLVPIIDYSPRDKKGSGPFYLSITINSISFSYGNLKQKEEVAKGNAVTILDTGSTSSIFPDYIIAQLVIKYSFQWSSQLNCYVIQEKEIPKDDFYVTFDFQNALIKVPLIDFTYPVIDGDTLSPTGMRSLQVTSSDSDLLVLGDDILQNVFFIVDMEDLNIALGQINPDKTSENIVVVRDKIVDAIKSNEWDNVWGYNGCRKLELINISGSRTPEEYHSDKNISLYFPGLTGNGFSW